jgi:hypothetical protein
MRSWSWILPACLVACSADASDVSLSVLISDESVTVTNGAFAGLEGGFQLQLALGSYANGSTQVTLGKFELQAESGAALADLADATQEPMFPVDLNKGESKRVVFTFDGIGVDHDAACAGRVRIVGSVMDTLKAGTVPVQSGLITPDCG